MYTITSTQGVKIAVDDEMMEELQEQFQGGEKLAVITYQGHTEAINLPELFSEENTTESFDDIDPTLLFSTTSTNLLCKIIAGKIDAHKLAEEQLKRRGLDFRGEWVGFASNQKAL